jgi:large subunit ribosomal protein L33
MALPRARMRRTHARGTSTTDARVSSSRSIFLSHRLAPRDDVMAKGMTKAGAILVKLVSTAATGSFIIRRRNPKKMPKKLEMMKYDPRYVRRVCASFCAPFAGASRRIARVASTDVN